MTDIYADGADYNGIMEAAKNPLVKGFTTNPTLMRAAGVTDYEQFARKVINELMQIRPETNISLEVFADEPSEMFRQAKIISSWADEYDYQVYVKIPVMNTKGENNYGLIQDLNKEGVHLNVTAVFTSGQSVAILNSLKRRFPTIISVFAGRIADTCRDPEKYVKECMSFRKPGEDHVKFLWASCREVFNYVQAQRCECDIITMTHDQIKKLSLSGKRLHDYSRETVEMFYNDALKSGYNI